MTVIVCLHCPCDKSTWSWYLTTSIWTIWIYLCTGWDARDLWDKSGSSTGNEWVSFISTDTAIQTRHYSHWSTLNSYILDRHVYFAKSTICHTLTHWCRVTHICVINIIDSDNDLSCCRLHTIIWTNDTLLLIWTLRNYLSESYIEIHTFSFNKMRLKISSVKWWSFCLGSQWVKSYKCAHGFIVFCYWLEPLIFQSTVKIFRQMHISLYGILFII